MGERWTDEAHLRWERACLERARAGDRAAFAELYRVFAPELYRRVLMPRLGHAQAAQDALSETFRTFLERMDRYEDEGKSVWVWLARVAANKAMDMHRVKARTGRGLANFERLIEPLVAPTPSPGAELEARGEQARIHGHISATLDKLNPRYRRAIELRFFEDRPRQQCAEALEVKLGTFDVLLLRALRAFRREWEAMMAAPSHHVEVP